MILGEGGGEERSRDVIGWCQYSNGSSDASDLHVVTFDSRLTFKKLHLVFCSFIEMMKSNILMIVLFLVLASIERN